MPGEVGDKTQPAGRAKRRDPGQRAGLRVSHPRPSAQLHSQDEIARLKEVIVQLECEREKVLLERELSIRTCKEEATESESTALRWKINQLEGEKLELASKHNHEVSQLEAQVARLRAQVERGEAMRQTLEYDFAVATRDSASHKSKAEARLSGLQNENQELKGLNAELCQTAQDMQRALEISRQAREEDLQGLNAELAERDQLLLTAHAENDQLSAEKSRLQALLQEQDDALRQLREKLDVVERERDRDSRSLRQKASELSFSVDREKKRRKELEMKLKTAEAALQAEQSVQQDVTSGLQALREKLKEAENAQAHEKGRANEMQARLIQMEKEHLSTKTELSTLLKEEKATSSHLRETIQEQQSTHTLIQEQLSAAVQKQKSQGKDYESILTQLEQLLQDHSQQGEANTHTTGEGSNGCPSAVVDGLRTTLNHYKQSLERIQSQMEHTQERNKLLSQDISQKDEVSSTLRKASEEHAERVCELSEEVQRLRSSATEAVMAADRAQSQLQELQQHCTDTQAHMHTLRQQYHREEQEKLAFLHSLYQRLVAGCVLIKSPHGLMGSFSWEELCAVLQEQTDLLLTDLHSTKEQVLELEAECERKAHSLRELHESHSGAVEGLTAQLRLREQSWLSQKEELLKQQTSLTEELHLRTQELRREVEASKERVCAMEREKASVSSKSSDLRERLRASAAQSSALLHGAALLAGCLWPLLQRVRDLARQKRALAARLDAHGRLERELHAILHALTSSAPQQEEESPHTHTHKHTPEVEPPAQRRGVWGFRRVVIGVLAAQRLQALGRRSLVCFRAHNPYGEGLVCVRVCEPEPSRRNKNGEEVVEDGEWTQSAQLKTLILSCTEDGTDMGSRFSRLLERLVADSDNGYSCYMERKSLSRQLAKGLYQLRKTRPISTNQYNSKSVISSLQQHILAFTQRLHVAEVERRNMRVELTQLRRQAAIPPPLQDPKHTACVPAARLEELLCELSAALQREQQAQELLHQQAQQLQELGLSMELHAGDQQEKDRTLAVAVKSLSECKAELRRKDQSLRQLGKHLSQAQQDKQELQHSIHTAENALRMAAKTKDSLASFMKSVESSLKEVKDRIVLHSPSLSPGDIIWHVPNMHLEMPGPERLLGGPEVATCQGVVSCFAEVYQLLCSKLVCVETELESRRSHISALKEELQKACLRERSPVSSIPDLPAGAGDPKKAEGYAALPVKSTCTNPSASHKRTTRPGKKPVKQHL